ncbi:hypothetical protein GUJ93_ZPchr0005g16252 [Zizania palustris]|uniref:Uncharacterized protein n=1 Tax=Zizania palustris TaxID=103762 RepID=A0A8J5S570_ZIZPA|nr:hypothetical protein GUJ93_ZPchr0005g16252 [Zizania palustris]
MTMTVVGGGEGERGIILSEEEDEGAEREWVDWEDLIKQAHASSRAAHARLLLLLPSAAGGWRKKCSTAAAAVAGLSSPSGGRIYNGGQTPKPFRRWRQPQPPSRSNAGSTQASERPSTAAIGGDWWRGGEMATGCALEYGLTVRELGHNRREQKLSLG